MYNIIICSKLVRYQITNISNIVYDINYKVKINYIIKFILNFFKKFSSQNFNFN